MSRRLRQINGDRVSVWYGIAVLPLPGARGMAKKTAIVLGFAICVWAFCGALIAIGRQFMGMDATLILHAVGAPLGAALFSWIYFRNFGFTGPVATAAIFVGTALALDSLVVAPLIERSFAMFASVLGVWLPQALIFAATYATGRLVAARPPRREGGGG